MIVAVYVDDLLITGNDKELIKKFKSFLSREFEKIPDLEDLKKYLGIEIDQDNGQLHLHHQTYINDILVRFKLTEKMGKQTPLPINLDSLLEESNQKDSIQEILGSLRFLADRCRPDISFACSFLARNAAAANHREQMAAERVARYLKETINDVLVIGSRKKEVKLFAFSDASFIRDRDSKSQIGYALYLSQDSGSILAKSKKDKSVSLSSTHAEINAVVECIKEVIWHRMFLEEMGFPQVDPTPIFVDNINIIHLSIFIGNDSKSKYLLNKINYIKEKITLGEIKLFHIPTELNVADLLTKSLDRGQFNILKELLLKGFIVPVIDG